MTSPPGLWCQVLSALGGKREFIQFTSLEHFPSLDRFTGGEEERHQLIWSAEKPNNYIQRGSIFIENWHTVCSSDQTPNLFENSHYSCNSAWNRRRSMHYLWNDGTRHLVYITNILLNESCSLQSNLVSVWTTALIYFACLHAYISTYLGFKPRSKRRQYHVKRIHFFKLQMHVTWWVDSQSERETHSWGLFLTPEWECCLYIESSGALCDLPKKCKYWQQMYLGFLFCCH